MSTPTDSQLDEYLAFAMGLAKESSRMIQEGQAKRYSSYQADPQADGSGSGTGETLEEKKNSIDLVTETDQAVEAFIKREIAARYPEHAFLGEETYAEDGKMVLGDEFTWIVDPIDGTTNFIHNNPFVGCSIGLVHRGSPVVGAIILPFMCFPNPFAPMQSYGTLYAARRGGGAYMNETARLPLGGRAAPMTTLQRCVVDAEWGTDRQAPIIAAKSASFDRLVRDEASGGKMVHALRTTGSTVTMMAQIASGQMDVHWDTGCYPWDVAAGAIIIREAGGYFGGGKSSFARGTDSDGEVLLSRRYCSVRPVAASATETARQVQQRILRELYDAIEQPKDIIHGFPEVA